MQTPPQVPEAPPATSLASRLANVVAAPGEVFDEVKASGPCAANWVTPALLLLLVSWIGGWLVLSQATVKQQLNDMAERAVQKQFERAKQSKPLPEAQKDAAKKIVFLITKISAIAGPPVIAFLSPIWWGLVIWLVGTKAFKADFGYMKAVEVAGLGNMIGVLAAVIGTLLILSFGSIFASPSLALLVKDYDTNNPAHALATSIDVMYFWLLTTRSIGLAKLSGAPLGKAAAWVFGLWGGYTALKIGAAYAIRAATGG